MSVSCPARPILRPSPGALGGYVTTITTTINTHPNPRQNLPSIPVGKISKKSLIFRLMVTHGVHFICQQQTATFVFDIFVRPECDY